MEWLYDKFGKVSLIIDGDCFRDKHGRVVAFIDKNNVFSTSGEHKGWFEGGVLFDLRNKAICYLKDATAETPVRPVLFCAPVMPVFYVKPVRPVFCVPPVMPVRGQEWSHVDLGAYFD